ncbi:protein OSCP1 isoform X2 [Ictidomys tridecemlineatus]|uniref:Organic solute carrier partner 1 n=1 Tax=Ictidomys tridecemlineatus TaxID=43179 RepID=A0A287D7W5_ICTTR|nr:protein OSCP1 isoform X1 [Ictidomys tridecemlineatus]KAG3282761.1 organic solute carrier partner 1, transcript variant X1 [Ictidomys tridecemlineatus]
MSVRTLPLLFLNLGGEMLYILDQRLRAQNIPGDKARKDEWTEVDRKRVLNDIISTMFNRKFMEELFKPQELYSKKALRTVYNRLAHASIMRLNQASMDKLYDLMTMAFKYQVLLCPRPKDVLLVTFNHLDAIKGFIQDSPTILNQVDETFRQLTDAYGSLSAGEFQLIRQTLLIFFQDLHIRVSIFLKDRVQNSNGRFVLPVSGPVPWGTEVPGLIRMFNNKGEEVKKTEFKHGGNYVSAPKEGSFELYGDRVLKLGTNMYSVNRTVETHMSAASKNLTSQTQENITPNPLAKEELNFLARLMGGMEIKKPSGPEPGFRLNLFTTDEEEEHAAQSRPEELTYDIINIQAIQDQQQKEELARIMGEFEIKEQPRQSSSKGDDLLAMMDEL